MRLIITFLLSCFIFCIQASSIKISAIGFNVKDCTAFVYEALNSEYDTVIFDKQSTNWFIKSSKFFDIQNKTIFFEEGVIVAAIRDSFSDEDATLLKFVRCKNITLIGYGAELVMNKDEYIAYNNSEYRHGLSIENSVNVTVKGLTIRDTGGDGIYIGGANYWQDNLTYSKDILIEDVRCINNYRQGMSITSVENMKVINCHFSRTKGTLPEAGVDVEPFETYQRIVNLEFKNCKFFENNWAGLAIALVYMDSTSLPVSISVNDCIFQNNGSEGHPYGSSEIYVGSLYKSPVKGNVTFNRSAIDGSDWTALYTRKTSDAFALKFKNCIFNNVSRLQKEYNEPIFLEVPDYDNASPFLGGIELEDVYISYPTDFPFLRVFGWNTLEGIKNITGDLTIVATSVIDTRLENVAQQINFDLRYKKFASLPKINCNFKSIGGIVEECKNEETISFKLDNVVEYPVLMNVSASGTAKQGLDYNLLTQALIFEANQTESSFVIKAREDRTLEQKEEIFINIMDNDFTQKLTDNILLYELKDCFIRQSDFDYNTSGKRVCLTETTYDENQNKVTIYLLDANQNVSDKTFIYRRNAMDKDWQLIASDLAPGTLSYTDENVEKGKVYEYQIKRKNTWSYKGIDYDAIGYTSCATLADRTGYRGQMILLISNDVAALTDEIKTLKSDLTNDGWFVNVLEVVRAEGWDSRSEVIFIKQQIDQIYDAAPADDKPKQLFILGHVPLPRAGRNGVPPDEHAENIGARGADGYYADLDGIYRDTGTFKPVGLATPLALNLPGDYKWDEEMYSSDLEMGFGRVDFADLTETQFEELELYKIYLKKLHLYKIKAAGYDMGSNTAYFKGYDNSTDGSYRSLPSISKFQNVILNNTNEPHPKWVKENGPFLAYTQNLTVPEYNEWLQHGMNAVVFSSDQSYYGFGDVPQEGLYSRIRALLALDNKNLVNIWSTMAINLFPLMGVGETIGESCKRIMNHNDSNKYYEKPHQDFDNPDFWYRMQFAVYGDPTVRFYQIRPVKDIYVLIGTSSSNPELVWTASTEQGILRYDIYESTTQFGFYNKIGSTTNTYFELKNSTKGNWYMVKAIAIEETGSGKFYNSSLGVAIENPFDVNTKNADINNNFFCYPNPTDNEINIESAIPVKNVEVLDLKGRILMQFAIENLDRITIPLRTLQNGLFIFKIQLMNGQTRYLKVVKN